MQKKENTKKPRNDGKVEDLYGVHFKYQDLFSRLLKVQKERKVSEEKLSIPRIPSFDSATLKKPLGKHLKKENVKKSNSSSNLKPVLNNRSVSVKKVVVHSGLTDRVTEIMKSYSPNQKRNLKTLSEVKKVKKPEKKSQIVLRLTKKHMIKPKHK